MNLTILAVTCLLFAMAAPLAGATAGIVVGIGVGPAEVCVEVLGEDLISFGCTPPPCSIHPILCEGRVEIGTLSA